MRSEWISDISRQNWKETTFFYITGSKCDLYIVYPENLCFPIQNRIFAGIIKIIYHTRNEEINGKGIIKGE